MKTAKIFLPVANEFLHLKKLDAKLVFHLLHHFQEHESDV